MASLKWYIYKQGDQYATITVNYTENIEADHSTIKINSIKYYNSYTSDSNSSGALVYWTGLTLKITWDSGSHTVISGMNFDGCTNASNTKTMKSTTPEIPLGSSVNFVLSGTLTPHWDYGTLDRDPLTVGSSTGSDATTKSVVLHSHSWTSTVIAPTCTEKGYTLHTCNGCESSYKDTYVDALGHSYEDGECIVCGVQSAPPMKKKLYIYDGTNWIKYKTYVYMNNENKRMTPYIHENVNRETAMLGLAVLGIMKLGEEG